MTFELDEPCDSYDADDVADEYGPDGALFCVCGWSLAAHLDRRLAE